MTIALSIKVNDGVVLAADSASTIISQDPQGKISVHNVYTNADKIFNLVKQRPIGVTTWGIGSIGQESIATLMKDLRSELTKDLYQSPNSTGLTVLEYAERVRAFIYDQKYTAAFANWKEKPAVGFLVAGFSPGESLAEEYRIDIQNGTCSQPSPVRSKHESGAVWNGEPEAITRLVMGYSSGVPVILEREFNFDADQWAKFQQHMGVYTAQLVTPAMPIIDAINLAEFLVETTVKFSRFSPGATTVDGPVEIAAITKHEGFKWIKRKHYYSEHLNPPLYSQRS